MMWRITEGPVETSRAGDDFVAYRWTLTRAAERVHVAVEITRTLVSAASGDQDLEDVQASKGRTAVERLLGFHDLPDKVTFNTAYPDGHLTSLGMDRGHLAPPDRDLLSSSE